jgi:hypothetical protein
VPLKGKFLVRPLRDRNIPPTLPYLRELRGLRASFSSPGLLRAPHFTAGSGFSGRRKTRTEVTVFTEGSTDIELAARLSS